MIPPAPVRVKLEMSPASNGVTISLLTEQQEEQAGKVNYQETLDYIYSFLDAEKTGGQQYNPANYDLRRVEELLVRLGSPHRGRPSVHIAGTKGKGSTAAMVASVLVASGYRTGLFTSPHLIDLRERIRVNNEFISENELIHLVAKIRPEVSAVNEKATYGEITTFEVLTALGFGHFQQKGAEFQVVEVGLGGELDATNVITPEVAVITSISYDHMQALGNTLDRIATAKAGIIKPGITVVSARQPQAAARVIAETCRRTGAHLIRVGESVNARGLGFANGQQHLLVRGRLDSYRLAIPLLGYYQLDNAASAVAALEALSEKGCHISRQSIIKGLAEVSWPGRFEILSRRPLVLVDGAHNRESARRLREAIEHYFHRGEPQSEKEAAECYRKAILLIGMSRHKDSAGIASELHPIFDQVIVTRSQHPRAMAPDEITGQFQKYGLATRIMDTVPQAVSLARELATGDDLVCATGSLFVVGEVIAEIRKAV
jgi:dihydrofolate synthase/folylpolyglutamate synthase